MPQEGLWFDGETAVERTVRVREDQGRLLLDDRLGRSVEIEPGELVRLAAGSGQVRFGHRQHDGWRLVLAEPICPSLKSLLPSRGGSLAPHISRRKLALLMGLSVVATLVAGTVILAPEFVAAKMPMAWERKLGAAYQLPIDWAKCEGPATRQSLDELIDRIDPEARADGFTLDLVDVGMANAVALPGGRMLLFSGILKDVEDVDAVAGIVAHEIAHVRRRHVAAGMVRELGLGAVLTLMGGGAIASNAAGLASLKFSRDAESEADSDAVAMLARAKIDPRPTAGLFRKFSQDAGERSGLSTEFLESHPLSEGRALLFERAFDRRLSYRPVLAEAQWLAMKQACSAKDPSGTSVG